MAKLTEAQKTFIVQRLACYETHAQIIRDCKELFDLEIERQHVQFYDPEVPSTKTPKKWVDLWKATREAYLKARADVGIANPRRRMELRQRLLDRAMDMGAHGNIPLALEILEQAEKAEGGAFTNRHKVQHSGQVKTTGVLVLPVTPDDWSKQARTQQQALEKQATRAAEEGARGAA